MSLTLLVVYFDLPLYILFAGSFFNGMTGYFPAIVLATMAYISDTTTESMRAARLGEYWGKPKACITPLVKELGKE
jgi:hypothetical protein